MRGNIKVTHDVQTNGGTLDDHFSHFKNSSCYGQPKSNARPAVYFGICCLSCVFQPPLVPIFRGKKTCCSLSLRLAPTMTAAAYWSFFLANDLARQRGRPVGWWNAGRKERPAVSQRGRCRVCSSSLIADVQWRCRWLHLKSIVAPKCCHHLTAVNYF
jgi:hypothetical protein